MYDNNLTPEQRSKIGWIAMIFVAVFLLGLFPLMIIRNKFGIDGQIIALLELVVLTPIAFLLSTIYQRKIEPLLKRRQRPQQRGE